MLIADIPNCESTAACLEADRSKATNSIVLKRNAGGVMSNEKSSKELKGTAKPSVTDPLINTQNLALLHKRDRAIIMGVGLVMSMAGTAIVTLGKSNPTEIVAFAVLTVVAVVALLVLVYLRGSRYSGMETRLNSENAAARAINGHWWQIVHTDDHPGLTYIAIGISGVAERSAMVGRTYDYKGNIEATFSSDAVAIRTTSPIEIFYMWTGTVMKNKKTPLVFGVGRFRFDSVGHEDRPVFGSGMFTRGSKNQMEFEPARPVEMRRLTPEEEARLIDKPELLDQLAIDAYERFHIPKDVGLLEAGTDGKVSPDTSPPEAAAGD
jgi:hypothetical protein